MNFLDTNLFRIHADSIKELSRKKAVVHIHFDLVILILVIHSATF